MFVLVEMVDTVRIPPWQFERKLNDSIAEELNKKLANKVVYNVGLCICLYDITKLEDAYVFPGDGASHTKVHFRYVVFHPFLDEILIGVIKGCSPDGVHAMRPSRCGFGNMRRKKEPMTCTWTPVRRSASGWWMRALLTRPRQAPVLPRLRPPVKRLPRKRPLTPSWDPSVNQAWGFSLGGLAVSASQKMLPVPAA
ncbi:DNA-directed RNA polymerase III subunit RPC8 isoform X2 [Vombatus ursinus]|uniref:DNA-directed RNA polymerase III subunit RPC8 isoform X2 n=1 Tax=Vombatus ursinus TaxID=29139 RepID=UPI000FFDA2BA|nr:DNA-directed RNA polymerase III subunit RPC8 isoform X2 [Vombatus ursinus]